MVLSCQPERTVRLRVPRAVALLLRLAPFAGAQGTAGRVAWLLRVNRLLGENAGWLTHLRLRRRGQGRHATRRPRQREHGVPLGDRRRPAPFHGAIRRYEELLDLPAGNLVAPVDALHRYVAPRRPARPGAGPPRPRRPGGIPYRPDRGTARPGAERRLDVRGRLGRTHRTPRDPPGHAARTESTVDGSGRPGCWREMIASDGLAWMQRSEAMHRLLGHPVGQAGRGRRLREPDRRPGQPGLHRADGGAGRVSPPRREPARAERADPTDQSRGPTTARCWRASVSCATGISRPDQLVAMVGVIADAVHPGGRSSGHPRARGRRAAAACRRRCGSRADRRLRGGP